MREMTYEEYEEAVALVIYRDMADHGWSLDDARACAGCVQWEYASGAGIEFAAFRAIQDTMTAE